MPDGADPRVVREEMEKLLREEASLVAKLQLLLNEERSVLETNDIAALDRAGKARHECAEALLRLDDERRATCRMLSLDGDATGFRKLLGWCDSKGGLIELWQRTLKQAAVCRDMNESNGSIVAAKLRRVSGLLGALRGNTMPALYGPPGTSAASEIPSRALASA